MLRNDEHQRQAVEFRDAFQVEVVAGVDAETRRLRVVWGNNRLLRVRLEEATDHPYPGVQILCAVHTRLEQPATCSRRVERISEHDPATSGTTSEFRDDECSRLRFRCPTGKNMFTRPGILAMSSENYKVLRRPCT